MTSNQPPPTDPEPVKSENKSEKTRSLLRSTGIVSAMTMLSRILGLIRDIVVAGYFGASSSADAFFVAFKVPNFLRRLFGEGAFAQAFVPVLSEYKAQRGITEVKELVDRVAGSLGMVTFGISGFAILTAPWLVMLFAPGWIDLHEKLNLAAQLLQITFPYLFFISLVAFCGSILNSYNSFGPPAFAPVILNICLISATVFFTDSFDQPVMALGWAVFIAGILQLLWQLPFLARLHLVPLPKWDWRDEGVQKIIRLMIPALFGVSVGQINLFLDTVLASFLETGSVSWLYFSDRLMELPLGVFGIAIGTVILPALSQKHAEQEPEQFSRTIDWALRTVLVIGAPAAIALFALAEPILTTLFQYGNFSETDVAKAALSLRAYAGGLLAFMLIKVLAPGYFARQDTKTPVAIAVKAMIINMGLNLVLIWPLAHAGLALATSISAFINAGLLFWGLKKTSIYRSTGSWPKYLSQLFCGLFVMGGVLYLLNPYMGNWFELSVWQRSLNLTILVMSGAIAYFLALFVVGIRVRHFRSH